jgi:hypothetical protein
MLPLREKVATNEDTINLKHVSVAVPALLGNDVATTGGLIVGAKSLA